MQESIDKGRVKEETGYYASRNKLQTTTLLDTLEQYHFDAAIGGARRDEEKARAKERFFSHRDEFGQWNPKNQRPELWNIFNGRKAMGEHFRVFPISNWTEMDVWQYILQEKIDMPSLYFTHERQVFQRDGQWLAAEPCIKLKPTEQVVTKQVRCRTIAILEKEPGVAEIKMNDIAEITIHTAQPLAFDDYRLNRITGSVIFIDPDTNETVGAGMIKTETIWNKHNSYVI